MFFSQLYDLLQDYSAIGEYVLVFDEFVVSTVHTFGEVEFAFTLTLSFEEQKFLLAFNLYLSHTQQAFYVCNHGLVSDYKFISSYSYELGPSMLICIRVICDLWLSEIQVKQGHI